MTTKLTPEDEAIVNVITIAQQCSDCCGNGFHIHDSCDHRGEHIQDEWTCETCEGSGLKDGV